MVDLVAGAAVSAAGATLAQQRPGERKGDQTLADPFRPDKEIGMGDTAMTDGAQQNIFLLFMAADS